MKFINFKNLSVMYVGHIAAYLLSFLLMPYLARTLKVDGFGEYSYVVGVNTYLWIMVEWGYPIGGVRDVSSNRHDAIKLQNAFWTIIFSKFLFLIPATGILLALAFASDSSIREVVILSGACTLIGSALACDWFAQGVERLGLFTLVSIAARILVSLTTFIFVRDEGDADIAALLHGLNGLLAGLAGFAMMAIMYRYAPRRQKFADIKRSITSSFSLFLAKANSILYVSAPPLVLGIVANSTQIGIYSGADKIARICVMLIGPIGMIVAPTIFSSMQTSKEVAAMMSGRYLVLQAAITAPISLALFLFAPQIVFFILGDGYDQSATILRLLAPVPFLVGVSSALANQFLAPLALDRSLGLLSLACAMTYVLILAVLSINMAAFGAAIALILAEIIMIAGAAYVILRGNREYVRNAWIGIRTFNPIDLIWAR